jgi:hypothetical protein
MDQTARFTSIIFAPGDFFPNCHISFTISPANRKFLVIFRRLSHHRRAGDTALSSRVRRGRRARGGARPGAMKIGLLFESPEAA